MPASLSIVLVTRGSLDVRAALLGCVYDAFADQGTEDPDEESAEEMIAVVWSRDLKVNDGRRLHRATFSPAAYEDLDEATSFALIRNFADRVRKLTGNTDPGVTHVVHFANAALLDSHERLYREIYEIEMRLREVLTCIFLDEYPDRAYEFLDGNKIALQGEDSNHTAEYLAAHGENQLFHVLFNDYDELNQNPVGKPADLLPLIRDNQTYDKLREAVKDAPIKKDRHVSFIAALKAIVPDIEAVRNAVAHNRDLPKRAEQKYEEACKKFGKLLIEFWAAEAEPDAIFLPPDPAVMAADHNVETEAPALGADGSAPTRPADTKVAKGQRLTD